MLTAQDLHGVMSMMPGFATADAADINATATVDVDNLKTGVNRMIGDGVDFIVTTGSFGEFHTLLFDEFETLARATIETVANRVPLLIGCTALNSREVVQKMKVVRDAGGAGVLLGVPFYFPSTVENAVRFYHDIADMFPTLGIMIYHNPPLHNITIPVEAFKKISEKSNIIGLKDSHRPPLPFMKLMEIVRGKISIFPNQWQAYPYCLMGAPGFWSTDSWMGPWPVLRLRDVIKQGNLEEAQRIVLELASLGEPQNPSWRETSTKLSVGFAGYVNPGPLRPPFVEIPQAIIEGAQKKAIWWQGLCEKYRPLVETMVAA